MDTSRRELIEQLGRIADTAVALAEVLGAGEVPGVEMSAVVGEVEAMAARLEALAEEMGVQADPAGLG